MCLFSDVSLNHDCFLNALINIYRWVIEYSNELQEIGTWNHGRCNLYPTGIGDARNIVTHHIPELPFYKITQCLTLICVLTYACHSPMTGIYHIRTDIIWMSIVNPRLYIFSFSLIFVWIKMKWVIHWQDIKTDHVFKFGLLKVSVFCSRNTSHLCNIALITTFHSKLRQFAASF